MTEISNIDAIVELTLREARARKDMNLIQRILAVHSDVFGELVKIFDTIKREEMKEKEKDNQAEWAKEM